MKFNPVMVTSQPNWPLVGVNEVMVGSTGKSASLVAVPLPLVTVIFPVVAPRGTVVVIDSAPLTVKLDATPLNFTAVVPVKLVPVIVTVVPTLPDTGANEPIAGNTLKFVALVADPLGVVTEILPVSAPAGTVASIVL